MNTDKKYSGDLEAPSLMKVWDYGPSPAKRENPESPSKYMTYIQSAAKKYDLNNLFGKKDENFVEPYMRVVNNQSQDSERFNDQPVRDEESEVASRLDELENLKIDADRIMNVMHACHEQEGILIWPKHAPTETFL